MPAVLELEQDRLGRRSSRRSASLRPSRSARRSARTARGVDREEQRLRAEIAIAATSSPSVRRTARAAATGIRNSGTTRQWAVAEIAELRQTIESKRQDETEPSAILDQCARNTPPRWASGPRFEAIIAEHGYSTDSVRRLFQSGALHGGHAPAGVLADFLEVDPRYEHVVDDFLRDELNYVVVKSWDAADEGLSLLRADVDGRATFLVHPDDSQAKFSFVVDEAAHARRRDDTIVPLKNCIRVLNGFGKSLEIDPAEAGQRLHRPRCERRHVNSRSKIPTLFPRAIGECFHNVTVTGGKQRSEGPLSMKRELRDVCVCSTNWKAHCVRRNMRRWSLGREIEGLPSLLDRLEDEKREAEKLAMTSGHMLSQLESRTGARARAPGT